MNIDNVDVTCHHRPHHLSPRMKTCRVAFVTRNYGSDFGMSNIGLGVTNNAMAKVLRREGYYAESWSARNAKELSERIDKTQRDALHHNHPPLSNVIITSPSWMNIREIGDLCWQYPNITFTLVNHTGTAYLQIDGNDEESGMMANKLAGHLELERHNFKLAANNVRFVDMIQRMLKVPCEYLPNLYDTESFVSRSRPRKPEDTIRIIGPGAPRPWKNQLTAAEAAVMLARECDLKLEFYYNQGHEKDHKLSRSREDLFRGEYDLKLIAIPWEPWPKFRQTIAHMDLMMQPSFDETYNVCTADGIAVGVPAVASPCIEWVPERWKANPCDPGDCCRVGIYLLNDPFAVEDGRRAMQNYVSTSLEKWKAFLGR